MCPGCGANLRPGVVWFGESLPTDAWDDADLEVKQENTARLLAGLPRQQRQALLLCAVHGFSEAEVADFQDRSQAEVGRDIEAAKENLAQQFADG